MEKAVVNKNFLTGLVKSKKNMQENRKAKTHKEKKRFYKSKRKFDKSDTCHKCGRFGHYAKDCIVKENIKTLDIER
ncbi:hypothetical protein H5410_006394 [Solanum commersonii]|uniref:CCHC-type domain-containing protein n=1 Tax=Solanum commersonii TaxID=4109 RepID=A0A9J6A9Q5_SOLCO|nr:hypothetical protein H5410_006394 [Solanum commersonii]